MSKFLFVLAVICLTSSAFAVAGQKYPYANVFAAFQAGFEGKVRPVARATIRLIASRQVNGRLYFYDQKGAARLMVSNRSYLLAWWDGTPISSEVPADPATIIKFSRLASLLSYQPVDLVVDTNYGKVIDFPSLGTSYGNVFDSFQAGLDRDGLPSVAACKDLFR